MLGKAENGLCGGANVRTLGRTGKIIEGIRALRWPDRVREGICRKGKAKHTQMITITEIKKALAIQNSILKKENEMLKKQE